MKKNRMMRLASILLVCVLLTTSIIGGTFAKYTSTATVTDNARVAYWGFGKVAAVTFDLFSNTYDNGAVKSADDDNVVAPGTKQETTFAFKYTGNTNDGIKAPEVKYTVKVEPTITVTNKDTTHNLDKNPNFVWTLTDAKGTVTPCNTTDELLNAIKLLSGHNSGTATYEPGKLPAALTGSETEAKGNQLVTIGWEWKFDDTDGEDYDAGDTAMGNMDPLENVVITIKITATQDND